MRVSTAWHVAQTNPFQGTLAEKYLIEERNKRKVDFAEIFHPKVKATNKWSRGREVEITRPYIPGYIFIRFDTENDNWKPINHIFGVKSIMYSTEEIPARIRDCAIAPLLAICTSDGFLIQEDADRELYRVGRLVKVLEGTFEGFQAPIVWTSGQRLAVMMEIFGAEREVELNRKQVDIVF